MRFQDFFIDYKINLKQIEGKIKYNDLPRYRKIFIILLYLNLFCFVTSILILIISSIFFKDFYLNSHLVSYLEVSSIISFFFFFILIFSFLKIDNREKNLKKMSLDFYCSYSLKRMNMVISLLKNYNIDINNSKSINRLIKESKKQLARYNLIKILKFLGVVTGIFKSDIYNIMNFPNNNINSLFLVILYFALLYILIRFILYFFFSDKNEYEDLISDLRQVKLFYSNNKKNMDKLRKQMKSLNKFINSKKFKKIKEFKDVPKVNKITKVNYIVKVKNIKSLKKVHEIKIIISQ
ncbi:hypothetical protein [Mediannikoviicoccus vaginalis]|uniref:hypothetical protein n=1 Tax=Mediannikoviicoccus vaginalis TaxID=2899727 RepID=UPI001F391649|nr:hypothetical protein [Mediannikoviicoccus vaginalis]